MILAVIDGGASLMLLWGAAKIVLGAAGLWGGVRTLNKAMRRKS